MGRTPEIVNIPNWLWHAKGDKKGPVDLNKAFLDKGFIKT